MLNFYYDALLLKFICLKFSHFPFQIKESETKTFRGDSSRRQFEKGELHQRLNLRVIGKCIRIGLHPLGNCNPLAISSTRWVANIDKSSTFRFSSPLLPTNALESFIKRLTFVTYFAFGRVSVAEIYRLYPLGKQLRVQTMAIDQCAMSSGWTPRPEAIPWALSICWDCRAPKFNVLVYIFLLCCGDFLTAATQIQLPSK